MTHADEEMGHRTGDLQAIEQAMDVFRRSGAKVFLAFSLHHVAQLRARSAIDSAEKVQAYDEAITALEAVNARGEHGLACQARDRLLK